jgi:hypothetical protein
MAKRRIQKLRAEEPAERERRMERFRARMAEREAIDERERQIRERRHS